MFGSLLRSSCHVPKGLLPIIGNQLAPLLLRVLMISLIVFAAPPTVAFIASGVNVRPTVVTWKGAIPSVVNCSPSDPPADAQEPLPQYRARDEGDHLPGYNEEQPHAEVGTLPPEYPRPVAV